MKYYVVSDIHGHFDEMMDALNKTDFDLENKNHKLIINGDMFDRGKQSKEVLEFVYPLNKKEKAIVLKGNHELFLEDFLNGDERSVIFNCRYNGLDQTLLSLIPNYKKLSFKEAIDKLQEYYPFLKDWLQSLPYYYETKDYVITHAGLDFSKGDFRLGDFKKAVWIDPEQFFKIDLEKKYHFKKTLVVGHRFTCMLRGRFEKNDKVDHSIYYHHDNQKIGIDGGSYYSKHINVFMFEE